MCRSGKINYQLTYFPDNFVSKHVWVLTFSLSKKFNDFDSKVGASGQHYNIDR